MKEILEGISLLGLGIILLIWIILKFIACIMIAGLISTLICHLTGYYWWFSSIIIFSILIKIVFYNNDFKVYQDLVYDYNKENNKEINIEY